MDLERREKDDSITLAKLRKAATALGCDLHVVFAPKRSLEEIVRQQADAKARAERNRIVHTMRLEAQEEGVDAALDQRDAVDAWLSTRLPRLWD